MQQKLKDFEREATKRRGELEAEVDTLKNKTSTVSWQSALDFSAYFMACLKHAPCKSPLPPAVAEPRH